MGGLCRNKDGSWIFGFIGKLGNGHITKAELYVIYNGLRLGGEHDIQNLIIEFDSLVAVNKILNSLHQHDFLSLVIRNCKALLRRN